MAKAAMRMYFRSLAKRFQGNELVAISMAPGRIMTDMMKAVLAADPEDFPEVGSFRAAHKEGSILPPEEPARVTRNVLLEMPEPEYLALHGALYHVSKGIIPG